MEELAERIAAAKKQVEIGALYEHAKGAKYRVSDIVILEETREPAVACREENQPAIIFVRPLRNFIEDVTP